MKPHRFDPISFLTGLLIAMLGVVFLIPETPVDVVDALTRLGSWFWPALLLLVGIAVLVPVFLPKNTDEQGEGTPPTP